MSKVYITWHYTTHGIAYLKHVLSAFYNHRSNSEEKINWENLNQKELNTVFDNPNKNSKGVKFDKIIYLTTPQKSFDELSTRRFAYRHNYKDIPEFQRIERIYDDIRNKDELCYNLEKEREYIKQTYPEIIEEYSKTAIDIFEENLWMDIQHYDVKTQINWLLDNSNFTRVYGKDSFETKELNVFNLRDVEKIAPKLREYIESLPKNDEYFVNVSLGSAETQVAWHILADYNILPSNTRFFTTYDDKTSNKDEKFKLFKIKEIETKLIQNIDLHPYVKPTSEKRELVNEKFKVLSNTGFSVLLLGERGIGKSNMIKKMRDELNKKTGATTIKEIVEVNCATFKENEQLAEGELFGYKKGAFTGAEKDKDGLIKKAENGILFMDEVHYLSLTTQQKLMKAFQTDENNNFSIRPMSANKEEIVKNVKLVFASNRTIEELREVLLPDFYDRIVQHVIEIPSLRETPEDRKTDWQDVWKHLFPNEENKCPDNERLLKWLETLSLEGNYRDLEKIAMYYKSYSEFKDEKVRKKICDELGVDDNPLPYTKKLFEKYHSPKVAAEECISLKVKDLINAQNFNIELKYQLYQWAVKKYKSNKIAADILHVEPRTLNNWKNKIKPKSKGAQR